MEKTAYFRHALTGLVGKYPENYGALFPKVFERVESKDYNCVDCGPKDESGQNLLAELGDEPAKPKPAPRRAPAADTDDSEKG